MAASGEGPRAHGNLGDAPATGWLHDDNALSFGDGVYFSFPVQFVGSIVVPSVRSLRDDMDRQMFVTEAISAVGDYAYGSSSRSRRRASATLLEALSGEVTKADTAVNLCISAEALTTTPRTIDGVLYEHSMSFISIAGGGRNEYYTYIGYIGKDLSGHRECYVYDCGERYVEEVYATLGQSFKLAKEIAQRKRVKPKAPVVLPVEDIIPEEEPEEAAEYLETEPAEETKKERQAREKAEKAAAKAAEKEAKARAKAEAKEAKKRASEPQLSPEVIAMLQEDEVDRMSSIRIREPQKKLKVSANVAAVEAETKEAAEKPASMAQLVKTMNKRSGARRTSFRGAVKTAMTKLNSTEVKDNARPSWVYLSQAGTIANKVSLADLLKMDLEAKQNKLSGIEE